MSTGRQGGGPGREIYHLWNRFVALGGELTSEQKEAETLVQDRLELMAREADERRASFVGPPRDTLYHYTDTEGLLGIVRDRCIWATHARYLNDSSELDYVEEVLARCASRLVGQFSSGPAQRLAMSLADRSYGIDFLGSIFVSSFSEEPDVLSQWRAYSGDGGGYAIGLDTSAVPRHRDFDWLSSSLVGVLYEAKKQDEVIEPYLSDALTLIHRAAADRPELDLPLILQFRSSFDTFLARLLPALKNPGFREEREWRVVALGYGESFGSPVEFRSTRLGLTPFVELQWEERIPPPITDLVLGPTFNTEVAKQAAKEFLLSHGYRVEGSPGSLAQMFSSNPHTRKIKVVGSEVSYRPL